LKRRELENFLLFPSAIVQALREQATGEGVELQCTLEDVERRLQEILERKGKSLNRGQPLDKQVDGKAVLKDLYLSFNGLVYNEVVSGVHIARFMTFDQAVPLLHEITDAFGQAKATAVS
jgi:hypothetical protein